MLDATLLDTLNAETRERIKLARSRRMVSQAALASRCGVTRSTIAMIESGGQGLTVEMLFRIASALEIEAREVLPDMPLGKVPTMSIFDDFVKGGEDGEG